MLMRSSSAIYAIGAVVQSDHVVDFLTSYFGTRPVDLARVSHGEWSRAFTFRIADKHLVARFSALDEDFRKDQRATAYASGGLPIPKILDVGQALGGFYAISERAHGEFIDTLDAAGMRRLLPSLFATLDAAREVDVSDSHGFGIWGADCNAPHATWRAALLDIGVDARGKRTYGWRSRMAGSGTGCGTFDAAMARLEAQLDECPESRHLVHSDLLNYNALTAKDRVTAVIDWGSSLYGDFVFDIAWFTFWQKPWYPAWRSIDFAAEARRHYAAIGLDVPDFDARLRCCELYIAMDGMAYQAYKGSWSNLETTARRTLELLSD